MGSSIYRRNVIRWVLPVDLSLMFRRKSVEIILKIFPFPTLWLHWTFDILRQFVARFLSKCCSVYILTLTLSSAGATCICLLLRKNIHAVYSFISLYFTLYGIHLSGKGPHFKNGIYTRYALTAKWPQMAWVGSIETDNSQGSSMSSETTGHETPAAWMA